MSNIQDKIQEELENARAVCNYKQKQLTNVKTTPKKPTSKSIVMIIPMPPSVAFMTINGVGQRFFLSSH